MLKRSSGPAIAMLIGLPLAGAAAAIGVRLSADEACAELFGIELVGVHEGIGEP